MSTFKTSDQQKVRVYQIASEMRAEGLSDRFIVGAVRLADYYEGAYDLFELWANERDQETRDEIISDLQEEIEEYVEQTTTPLKKPYIGHNDLAKIAKDVTGFKAHLKTMVDQWGGISKLAREIGVPQPSLSRFFNNSSMPRRTTLYKIAEALNLSEKEIIMDWAA
jgi:DNA-binding phage protein